MNRDEQHMAEALGLAERGLGRVEPNPMVGAVVVRDGRVIGRGWHGEYGGPHAEIQALNDCHAQGHDPAGATMYVTLEPCCHHGRTPPCSRALVEAGLGRVVVAMIDPFEQVRGTGVRELREAGIAVDLGVGEEAAHRLNAAFVKRVTTGLPWVILKWAQTLDGRIATAAGHSQWISNEASRRRVHELRARADAIMVGIGTVLADDPQLTAREVTILRTAWPVVVDPDLRLPLDAKLIAEAEEATVTIAASEARLQQADEKILQLEGQAVSLVSLPPWAGSTMLRPDGEPLLDLKPLLEHLVDQHQATNVLVEGGAGLAGALLEQGLVDQALVFVAPKLLGDERAKPPVIGRNCAKIDEAIRMTLNTVERIGEDVLLDYRVGSHEL